MKLVFLSPTAYNRKTFTIGDEAIFYSQCCMCNDSCSKLKAENNYAGVIHLINVEKSLLEGIGDAMLPLKNPEGFLEGIYACGGKLENYKIF